MEFDPALLKGNVQTMILAVLQAGALHGYGLAMEIERRSQDSLTFGEGTIYPALRALERQSFIEGKWETATQGPAKKLYSLTDLGRRELAQRREIWRRFVHSIDLVLEGTPDARTA